MGSRAFGAGWRCWSYVLLAGLVPGAVAQGPGGSAILGSPAPPEIRHGRELLQTRRFGEAKRVFAAFGQEHPTDVQARLGLGDAELGLQEYEAAEETYRAVVAQQPELWAAHKNLVVVEAALGRWEDFEGERKILRLARERGAPGISARESDVIDSFHIDGQRWVVRAYFEPVGRSRALYNFEQFSATGRVERYVSLEDAAAAQAALTTGTGVRIGAEAGVPEAASGAASGAASRYALNWYSGRAHGTVAHFERVPTYEQIRVDLVRWVHGHRSE